MKRILTIMALAGMGILVVSPARMSAQETGPASVLTSLLRVFTSDSDAALALFTDDAVVRIIPPPPGASGVWSGKEEIKQFLQFAKMQNAAQEIVGSPTVNGNKITATVMVTVNDFRKWGVGPVEHTFEIVVEGEKVKSYTTTMAPAERGRVGAAAAAYQQGQPTDPASIVTTYIREYPGNAALEFFSDDAVVMIVPPPPGTSGVWTGKEEIRTGLFPFGQSQNTRPEIIGSPVVEGNKVTVRVMVQTNDFKRLGVGRVEHTNEVVVEGGKIKSFTSTMIPSERERVAAAVAARQAQPGQPPAGMPRTGNEQPMPFFLIIMSGMLAALVGLALRRATRPFTS